MATYYRDSWTAGVGVVNFDSFFLVANEKHFFLKSLRLNSHLSKPGLTKNEDIDPESKGNHKSLIVY